MRVLVSLCLRTPWNEIFLFETFAALSLIDDFTLEESASVASFEFSSAAFLKDDFLFVVGSEGSDGAFSYYESFSFLRFSFGLQAT